MLDAERQRDERSGRKAGALDQPPDRVRDVLAESVKHAMFDGAAAPKVVFRHGCRLTSMSTRHG